MIRISSVQDALLAAALRSFTAYEALNLTPPPASDLPPGVPAVQLFKPDVAGADYESRAATELALAGRKFADELLAMKFPPDLG